MDKEILTIDVQDAAFKKFLDAFKEFNLAVDDMPDKWKSVFEAVGAPAKSVGHAKKSIDGIAHSAKSVTSSLKHATAGMTKFGHAATKTARTMKHILGMATRFGAMGLALGGISAAGGMFGLDELANTAMRRRMSAKAAGMNVGKMAALKIAMSPVVQNPVSMADQIAAAANSAEGQSYLARTIGPAWKYMSRAQQYFEILNKAQNLMKSAPQGVALNLAKAQGYENFLTQNDLLRLKHTKRSTLLGYESMAYRNEKTLGFSNSTAREWTSLALQLRKFKVLIETDLIRSLSVLAPKIGDLTREFGKWLSSTLTSKNFSRWINDVDDGLGRLAHFLQSKQFQTDVAKFGSAISDVTEAILWAARKIEGVVGSPGKTLKKSLSDSLSNMRAEAAYAKTQRVVRHDAALVKFYQSNPRKNPLNWRLGYVGHKATEVRNEKNRFMGAWYWKRNPLSPTNEYNWRTQHNPMNVETFPGDPHAHGKAVFSSSAQSYRTAANLLERYYRHGNHSLGSLVNMYETGKAGGTKSSNAHAQTIAHWMHMKSAKQDVDLGNVKTLDKMTWGLARFEEKHKQSERALYDTIKQAITDGLRQGSINLDVSNSTGSRVNIAAYAAAIGP